MWGLEFRVDSPSRLVGSGNFQAGHVGLRIEANTLFFVGGGVVLVIVIV